MEGPKLIEMLQNHILKVMQQIPNANLRLLELLTRR
ncbi:hypothetical protein Calkr_0707 [Caldicellulosiruptor acetigenus I77R1B]|uniref:Uncharacterized protein n=1 Tax=Caldicellulosiruptor acetigenus (strain ATCC 700853 / DSM 12137 / I77R1B) TaxID=632335 RepID=E4SAM7_CALA7|nr:hypothetical protein Calkr_0707 [Caldicellulosiruptor acetigenus I77R1B]